MPAFSSCGWCEAWVETLSRFVWIKESTSFVLGGYKVGTFWLEG